MRDRKFLAELAGEYEGAAPVSIVLRDDNVLQFSVLGTVRELVPVRGTYFRIKDLASTAVEFFRDGAGPADRMAIYSAGSDDVMLRRSQ
jgi:hypothetical protein